MLIGPARETIFAAAVQNSAQSLHVPRVLRCAFSVSTEGTFTISRTNTFIETNTSNNLAVTAPPIAVSGPTILAVGQPGYSEMGTWTSEGTSGDYDGVDHYASSNGNNTASGS
jgi:hypothetical protein